MASIDFGDRSPLAGFRVTGQTFLMVTFTLVQAVTLGLWLTLVQDAPVISGVSAVGLVVLTFGLVLEHVLTDATVNGVSASALPDRQVAAISLGEALLWVLWLGVANRLGGAGGIVIAGALLATLLVVQHTVEDNILRGVDPFRRIADPGTVGFSVVEAIGATVWLLLVFEAQQFNGLLATVGLGGVDPAAVGLAALTVVLLVEHDIAVALAKAK